MSQTVDHVALGAEYTRQANAVVSALRPLLVATDEALLTGEVVCAVARPAPGPEWADLAARRVVKVLAQKGWLRAQDEPQARALARQALEPADPPS